MILLARANIHQDGDREPPLPRMVPSKHRPRHRRPAPIHNNQALQDSPRQKHRDGTTHHLAPAHATGLLEGGSIGQFRVGSDLAGVFPVPPCVWRCSHMFLCWSLPSSWMVHLVSAWVTSFVNASLSLQLLVMGVALTIRACPPLLMDSWGFSQLLMVVTGRVGAISLRRV